MRVFILGLDALEYRLVERWGLRNLLQRRHGTIEVGDEYLHPAIGEPYTPIIWASIITGKKPREHGIKDWWIYGNILDRLRYLPLVRRIKGKRRILSALGIRPRVPNKGDLRCPTLFEAVKPSVAVNVPAYNDPTSYHRELSEAFNRGLSEYIRAVWRVHEQRKRDMYRALRENKGWRLFMAYFDILDLLGHVCIERRRLELYRAYLEADRLAGTLASTLPDTVFLILSDHGMEPSGDGVTGRHSRRAFWSLNVDDGWEPRDFTDIYPRVLEWVGNKILFFVKQ